MLSNRVCARAGAQTLLYNVGNSNNLCVPLRVKQCCNSSNRMMQQSELEFELHYKYCC